VANDWKFGVISEGDDEFVHHKSKDSHLGGTSVVEFDGTLLELGLLIEGVPAEVNVSVAEVTDVLVASVRDALHEGAFKDSNEGDDLHNSGGGDGIGAPDGGNSVGVASERVARVVNVSWKVDSGAGHNLAKEGKLADTSVLDFDVTKAVESFLGFSTELSEGI
jgi:hypothetical protein